MQLQTYEERKRSADTLYETSRLSRKEIQDKLRTLSKMLTPGKKTEEVEEALGDEVMIKTKKDKPVKVKTKPSKSPKPVKTPKINEKDKKKTDESWDSIEIK